MTEWGVVCVIISLVGLISAIGRFVTPITEALTKLSVLIERVDKRLEEHILDSKGEHNDLWDKVDDHEIRIVRLELEDGDDGKGV